MKLERLTENKIRILLKKEDFKDKNIDLHSLMTRAIDSQHFFLEILSQAEKQLNFYTDGYKLLIEAYSSPDNDFVFTITKYLDNIDESNEELKTTFRKKAVPRRRKVNLNSKCIIYSFDNFDAFCDFCTCLGCSSFPVRGLARSICLYKYNSTYYLVFKNINRNTARYESVFSSISEFGKYFGTSPSIESRLLEYGTLLIKHNALTAGIKFFS